MRVLLCAFHEQLYLFRTSADPWHKQPTNALCAQEGDHRRLDDPDAFLGAHDADHEWPEGAPALPDGTHERERVCVHAPRDELAPRRDRGGVERRDRDADERGADGGRGEEGQEPREALERDGYGDVDEDGAALAEEEAERGEGDAAQGKTCCGGFSRD